MILRLLLILALAAGLSSCGKPAGSSALSPADEKRLSELRELEERAAQRDAEAKATQLEADRQKLAEDQAALEEEKRQLAAQRDAVQNDPQRQAQYLQSERRIQDREAEQRLAQERADAAERAADAAREAHETKRAAAAKKIDFFYDALDPMGDWMEVQPYGYVWQPREAQSRGWRPYTDGTWVYTDYGWTWKGNEPFGWATYHYGRWTRLQERGWVWVPGSEWAPAWVSWRKSPNYVGWAPLPPEAHSSSGFNSAVDSYYDIGPTSYNFVPARSIGEPTYRGIVIEPERNHTIIIETSNVTRMGYANYGREPVYYNQGPDYDEISRYGGRPIPRYRIERESSRERLDNGGSGNSIAGNVLRLLAPQIAPAPRAAAPPTRVAAHLTSAPDHGWGTGGHAQEFRAKAQQEATQAEQLARTQPASTPYIRSGTRPTGGPAGANTKPFGGPFATGATPAQPHLGTPGNPTLSRFGTSSTPKNTSGPATTPRPFVGTEPLATPRQFGVATTPAQPKPVPELATPSLATPRRFGTSSTPTTPLVKGKKPPIDPVRPSVGATPASEAAPSRPAEPVRPPATFEATPKRVGKPTPPFGETPPLATPKPKGQTLDGSGLGREPATPPRVPPSTPKEIPVRISKPTPPAEVRSTPVPRAIPQPGPPVTRPATGGSGAPVIPASTPRKVPPASAEGGADPRKTLPPSREQATPAGSPTPKKKSP